MPIKIPDHLPAKGILTQEKIFTMDESRAFHQDIRSMNIVILNLMPTKETTETQLIRLLANTPLQIDIVLIHPKTHISKNTPAHHLATFYKTFDEIRHRRFDGMIITGAPVEQMKFEDVNYWEELKQIMEWTTTHVTSTFHICWAAQAGLYYHYGIPKYSVPEKIFGIFPHQVTTSNTMLLRGFDDIFYTPQSRHTEVLRTDIERCSELEVLAESAESGVYIVATKNGKQIFVTGHAEYDPLTLKIEYDRDVHKGLDVALPKNYYPGDDVQQVPIVSWRAHANLLFANWLNYYVYQVTPYDLEEVPNMFYI